MTFLCEGGFGSIYRGPRKQIHVLFFVFGEDDGLEPFDTFICIFSRDCSRGPGIAVSAVDAVFHSASVAGQACVSFARL